MASRFTRAEIRKILGDAHTEEIENQLIALHLGVVDPMKDDLQKAREKAEKFEDVQKELDGLKSGKDWKAEFDKEHQAFEDFRAEVAGKEALAAKQAAFRKLLSGENIPEKFHDRIIRLTDFDGMEMDGEGFKDEAAQRESISKEWGEYKATTLTQGDKPETPPSSGKASLTKADIYRRDEHGRYLMSTEERQKALAENPELMQ